MYHYISGREAIVLTCMTAIVQCVRLLPRMSFETAIVLTCMTAIVLCVKLLPCYTADMHLVTGWAGYYHA